MTVDRAVESSALEVWSRENKNVVDRYGFAAFKLIGLTGIAVSVTATFWGGFSYHSAYAMIFFLSLLFFIGGFAWQHFEAPPKEDLEQMYRHEQRQLYAEDDTIANSVRERLNEAKQHRTHVALGDWADRK